MAKEDHIELNGVVQECFPDTTFRVKCENGHELLCYLAGKLRKHYIRVLPGDHVRIAISPYDLNRGRIIRRFAKPPVPEIEEKKEDQEPSEDTSS